ncbi:MAG: gliding motility-associated protein GldE [Sphingobacteriales bacterium]|nr:MAG: gliding motility-associated protein GldE [Sphingobacteriales bacterium]
MDSSSADSAPPLIWLLNQFAADVVHNIWLFLVTFPVLNSDINFLAIAFALSVVIGLIFLSGIMSGSEIAFFSLTEKQLNFLRKQETPAGKRILHLIHYPNYLLATILIANNLVNISIVLISNYIIGTVFYIPEDQRLVGFIVNTVLVTFVLVLLGELTPKIYANFNNLRLAIFTSLPLSIAYYLLHPFSRLLAFSTEALEKRAEHLRKNFIGQEEIHQAIDIVAQAGNEGEPELKDMDMLKRIVALRNTMVKQIKRPRVDVFAIDQATPFTQVRELTIREGYSRIPVYADDMDHITGILYAKDLLEYLEEDDDFDWKTLLKEPFFVPENKRIYELLKEMQLEHTHLAIVVDEYGGTSGLITLEDILEEIVGDIKDEFDQDEEEIDIEFIPPNSYRVDGHILLLDLCKALKLDRDTFTEVKGEANSLAGMLFEISGKFLKKDDTLSYRNFKFTVLEIDDTNIEKVQIDFVKQD